MHNAPSSGSRCATTLCAQVLPTGGPSRLQAYLARKPKAYTRARVTHCVGTVTSQPRPFLFPADLHPRDNRTLTLLELKRLQVRAPGPVPGWDPVNQSRACERAYAALTRVNAVMLYHSCDRLRCALYVPLRRPVAQGFADTYALVGLSYKQRSSADVSGCLSLEMRDILHLPRGKAPWTRLLEVQKRRTAEQWSLVGNAVAVPLASALGAPSVTLHLCTDRGAAAT